jgi:hypothetical protein
MHSVVEFIDFLHQFEGQTCLPTNPLKKAGKYKIQAMKNGLRGEERSFAEITRTRCTQGRRARYPKSTTSRLAWPARKAGGQGESRIFGGARGVSQRATPHRQ